MIFSNNKFIEFSNLVNITTSDVDRCLTLYLEEDFGFCKTPSTNSDVTTHYLINKPSLSTINIVCKDDSEGIILSGMYFVFRILHLLDIKYKLISCKNDGDLIKKGDKIIELELLNSDALVVERTILNIIQQSSGVATKSCHIQNIVNTTCKQKNINNIKILDTRKTMLGSRILQKYSVFTSGSKNHRFGLYDKILIKDNHIEALGGMKNVIDFMRLNKTAISVEIECQNDDQVNLVVANADLFNTIMLDNFAPSEISRLAKFVKQGTKLFVEVSGGINNQNIANYCHDGVDFISIGELTHSVKSIDFSLNLNYIS